MSAVTASQRAKGDQAAVDREYVATVAQRLTELYLSRHLGGLTVEDLAAAYRLLYRTVLDCVTQA